MQMKIWNARLPGLYWKAKLQLWLDNSLSFFSYCFSIFCPEPTLKCKGWNFKRKLPLLFGKDQYWEWGIVIGSIIDLDPKPHSLCMHLLLIRGREGHRPLSSVFNWVLLSFSASVVRTLLKGTKAHGGVNSRDERLSSPHPWRSQLKNKDNSWVLRSPIQVVPEFSCVFPIQSLYFFFIPKTVFMWYLCLRAQL